MHTFRQNLNDKTHGRLLKLTFILDMIDLMGSGPALGDCEEGAMRKIRIHSMAFRGICSAGPVTRTSPGSVGGGAIVVPHWGNAGDEQGESPDSPSLPDTVGQNMANDLGIGRNSIR
jgi:hypothetical protein